MVNRRINVQIMPRMSFKFPSMMSRAIMVSMVKRVEMYAHEPSGPMLVSLTPREVMNSKALLTFSAFWIRILGFLL